MKSLRSLSNINKNVRSEMNREQTRMKDTDFDFKRIAQGYKDRPFLHGQVIERFQRDVTDKLFENGLDVGCGAGLSCKALKQICRHVTGADLSPEMVAAARELYQDLQGYTFLVSRAEEIPPAKEKYDIVTAAGVIAWVEKVDFLRNLRRNIRTQGYVLIYDFSISDRMQDNADYSLWWHEMYLKEFPKPFRNEQVWTKHDVEPFGFAMLGQVCYDLEYEFDRDTFVRFMMLQSNVNAKIEGEGRAPEEVQEWFKQTLAMIFGGKRRTVFFTGYSWYLRAC